MLKTRFYWVRLDLGYANHGPPFQPPGLIGPFSALPIPRRRGRHLHGFLRLLPALDEAANRHHVLPLRDEHEVQSATKKGRV